MGREQRAAFCTGPALLFIGDKLDNTQCFDILKVFQHAHAIFGAIAFIQRFQTFAWQLLAGVAEPVCLVCQFRTDDNAALDAVLGLMFISTQAARAGIPVPEKTDANGTVHTAGRDHLRSDHFRSFHFIRLHLIVSTLFLSSAVDWLFNTFTELWHKDKSLYPFIVVNK